MSCSRTALLHSISKMINSPLPGMSSFGASLHSHAFHYLSLVIPHMYHSSSQHSNRSIHLAPGSAAAGNAGEGANEVRFSAAWPDQPENAGESHWTAPRPPTPPLNLGRQPSVASHQSRPPAPFVNDVVMPVPPPKSHATTSSYALYGTRPPSVRSSTGGAAKELSRHRCALSK